MNGIGFIFTALSIPERVSREQKRHDFTRYRYAGYQVAGMLHC